MHVWHIERARALEIVARLLFFFFLRRPPAAYFERGLNVLNFSKVILLPLSCDEYISLHVFSYILYIIRNLSFIFDDRSSA